MISYQNLNGDYPWQMPHDSKLEDSDDEICPKVLYTPFDIERHGPQVKLGHVPHLLKDRLYQHPDYAFVVKRTSIEVFKFELKFLLETGGSYYEIYDRDADIDTNLVILFFEDSILDTMAETMKLNVQMKEFDCQIEFKVHSRQHFKKFNGVQRSYII
jgi:hypothetical protein